MTKRDGNSKACLSSTGHRSGKTQKQLGPIIKGNSFVLDWHLKDRHLVSCQRQPLWPTRYLQMRELTLTYRRDAMGRWVRCGDDTSCHHRRVFASKRIIIRAVREMKSVDIGRCGFHNYFFVGHVDLSIWIRRFLSIN